jgi:hypothetical protein
LPARLFLGGALAQLNLGSNPLGRLPPWLPRLSALVLLSAAKCNLQGALPPARPAPRHHTLMTQHLIPACEFEEGV